jgi:alpha-D-ribose 1-methylphosphonate 5-triphosphate diphosphatase
MTKPGSTQQASVRPGSMALASRRIVLADREITGTLHFENGLITGLEEGRLDPRAVDCGTDLIIPGLVELHTDHLEPHYSPRPKVLWEPVSAVFAYDVQVAGSGITTVFDSLRAGSDADRTNQGSGLFALGHALAKAKATGLLRSDHFIHLRCEICSEDVLQETRDFTKTFDVRLMSLMDHTPGARQFRDEVKLREYYRGKLNSSDAQLDVLFASRKKQYALYHDKHRRALVDLAHTNTITLASHDDTTVEHVAESAADKIGLAEFPTTTEAAEACRAHGIAVMMGAPNVVRGGSHSGNVSAEALARAGLLDVLSSDYVPTSLLMSAFVLAAKTDIALPAAICYVSKKPADAVGLTDRGEIAVGKRADLVRVAMAGDLPVVREVWRQGARVA